MRIEEAVAKIELIKAQPKKWLFGMDHAIDVAMLGLFTRVPFTAQGRKELGQAHMLWLDVPGVGKTDLVRALSFAIDASSQFIGGNPEMMPREIVGSEIYVQALGKFFLRKGPIFSNIILFDELNRTHPKAQAMFLQAMEERIAILEETDVVKGDFRKIEFPLFPIKGGPKRFFWVLATANPIENLGVYKVPEAQLDRFTFSYSIGHPPREEEKKIRTDNVLSDVGGKRKEIEKVVDLCEVLEICDLIRETVPDPKRGPDEYIMRIIENSRPGRESRESATDELKEYIDTYVLEGVSPRSNFHFAEGCRTQAFMSSRSYISLEDVKFIAPLVMAHRIILSPKALSGHITAKDVVKKILENTEVPVP
ncbi:MAG: MoxR family ATPase [Candidatus Liptonbacteria bacterium]|nr:MoxR family ATPase [Candidatus Liptonbacteria bacterium]